MNAILVLQLSALILLIIVILSAKKIFREAENSNSEFHKKLAENPYVLQLFILAKPIVIWSLWGILLLNIIFTFKGVVSN